MDGERTYYNKLVRDNVVEHIRLNGGVYESYILDGVKYKHALTQKLIEEAKEVCKSVDTKELIAELADVQEVFTTIMRTNDISEEDVRLAQDAKRKKNGGFNRKEFLIWASQQKNK